MTTKLEQAYAEYNTALMTMKRHKSAQEASDTKVRELAAEGDCKSALRTVREYEERSKDMTEKEEATDWIVNVARQLFFGDIAPTNVSVAALSHHLPNLKKALDAYDQACRVEDFKGNVE